MSKIDKINQHKNRLRKYQDTLGTSTTGFTCFFIVLTSWLNFKVYDLQDYLTIMISNSLLMFFVAYYSTQARQAARKCGDLYLLLDECNVVMHLASDEINELKSEIKKLKRIIDEQNNNVDSVRPSN